MGIARHQQSALTPDDLLDEFVVLKDFPNAQMLLRGAGHLLGQHTKEHRELESAPFMHLKGCNGEISNTKKECVVEVDGEPRPSSGAAVKVCNGVVQDVVDGIAALSSTWGRNEAKSCSDILTELLVPQCSVTTTPTQVTSSRARERDRGNIWKKKSSIWRVTSSFGRRRRKAKTSSSTWSQSRWKLRRERPIPRRCNVRSASVVPP